MYNTNLYSEWIAKALQVQHILHAKERQAGPAIEQLDNCSYVIA